MIRIYQLFLVWELSRPSYTYTICITFSKTDTATGTPMVSCAEVESKYTFPRAKTPKATAVDNDVQVQGHLHPPKGNIPWYIHMSGPTGDLTSNVQCRREEFCFSGSWLSVIPRQIEIRLPWLWALCQPLKSRRGPGTMFPGGLCTCAQRNIVGLGT